MEVVWEQVYYIGNQNLTISALVASIPIVVLLFLLGVKSKAADFAWKRSVVCITLA